ncbi:hypothetical protein [Microbispora sp. NPDC049633]|uniref:hypothetical protein n=1 Tax=Microbispora sp. NPDC049633 TaxID=3154355 RepID=UPI00341D1AEE
MSEIELRPGDRVRVTITGIVREAYAGDRKYFTTIAYASSETDTMCVTLPSSVPGVAFEYLAPAEWPPRPGDLWHDRAGDPWFAGQADFDEPVRMIGRSGTAYPDDPEVLLRAWGPMTLVHRQDEAKGGES